MARIRTIKPEFWSDEKLATVPRDARLLFAALLNMAEDHGVARGNPAYVRSQAFPYDDDVSVSEVSGWVAQLERAGVIRRFGFDGQAFIYITNFAKHQKIDRPTKPTLPAVPPLDESSTNPRREFDESSLLERKGEEGKGKEGSGEEERPAVPLVPLPPPPEDRFASGHAWFAHVQYERHDNGLVVEKPPGSLSAWWNEAGLELNGDYQRLEDAYRVFAQDKYWRERGCPFRAFVKQWRDYVPERSAA